MQHGQPERRGRTSSMRVVETRFDGQSINHMSGDRGADCSPRALEVVSPD